MFAKHMLTALLGLSLAVSASAKTIVAYFSCTGTTQQLAQSSARILKADIKELVPRVPYTENDLNWHDSSTRATVEARTPNVRPALAQTPDVSAYDTVVLAFPIHWGSAPKIVWTFLESQSFANKNIIAVCTSGSSGIEGAMPALKNLTPKSTQWLAAQRFPASVRDETLRQFFDKALQPVRQPHSDGSAH